MTSLSALSAGLLFGIGLIISRMIDPSRVIGFLDIFGAWDPSLAFVMAGAASISALGYVFARRRRVPLLASEFVLPARAAPDIRLTAGAAIFGIGWGLAGLCPGPALVAVALAPAQLLIFVAAMVAGMMLFQVSPLNVGRQAPRTET